MAYMSEDGFSAYYSITLLSHSEGLISDGEFLQRISWLRQVSNPENQVLNRVLQEYPEFDRQEEPNDEPRHDLEIYSGKSAFLKKVAGRKTADTPKYIYFLTAVAGILGAQWRFNPYDDDFFPSVPHGHLKSKHAIKLDLYLGFTYDTSQNNKALKRESRNYIVRLWNDEKFRTIARTAVEYYVVHHPNFSWRVPHPLRLPKKRRF